MQVELYTFLQTAEGDYANILCIHAIEHKEDKQVKHIRNKNGQRNDWKYLNITC